jgi:hypothetical protein
MNIDARLLANMIACGISAAGEELDEPLEVTINEAASTVYIRTRDGRMFRADVRQLFPFPQGEEEPRA